MADRKIRVALEAVISQYTAGLKQAGSETKAFGSQIEQAGARNAKAFAGIGSSAKQGLGQAVTASGELDRSITQTGRSFNASSLLMAAGTVAVVAGIRKAVNDAAEYAGVIRKVEAATGSSADESSRFVFVLNRLGIDAESSVRPLAILSKNIEQGGKNFKQYFTEGELVRLQTGSLIQAIPVLAEKYNNLATATERNTFLQNVFGRGGLAVRRLLTLTAQDFAKLSAEAERFGLVLTEKNLADFKRFSDGQRAMQQAAKGLEVQIGLATLPVMEAFDRAFVAVVTTVNSAPPALRNVAAGIGLVTVGLVTFGEGILSAVTILGGVAKGAGLLAGSLANAARAATGANVSMVAFAATEEVVAASGLQAAAATTLLGRALNALSFVGVLVGLAAVAKGAWDTRQRIREAAQEAADSVTTVAEAERKLADARGRAQQPPKFSWNPFENTSLNDLVQAQAEVGKLEERKRELEAQERRTGDVHFKTAKDVQEQTKSYTALRGAINQITTDSKEEAAAQERLQSALAGVDINSDQAVRAQALYARTLFDIAKASAEAEGSQFDEAKARAAAADQAHKFALQFIEDQRKTAEAVADAEAKITDSNVKLLNSFDLLRDGAKQGLEELRTGHVLNTVDYAEFVADVNAIFRAGFPALAESIKELGAEKGLLAARQAAQRLAGGQGLGAFETAALDMFRAAKQKRLDPYLDTWSVNLSDKGMVAGQALADALGQGADDAVAAMQQAFIDAAATVEDPATAVEESVQALDAAIEALNQRHVIPDLDTSSFDSDMAATLAKLNSFGLLTVVAKLAADNSPLLGVLGQTLVRLGLLTEEDWVALLQAREDGSLTALEGRLDALEKPRFTTLTIRERRENLPPAPTGESTTQQPRQGPLHEGGLVRHAGGPIIGRYHSGGRLGSDERLIIGQVGEYMSDRDTVAAWGGPAHFEWMKQAARTGGASPMLFRAAAARGWDGAAARFHDGGAITRMHHGGTVAGDFTSIDEMVDFITQHIQGPLGIRYFNHTSHRDAMWGDLEWAFFGDDFRNEMSDAVDYVAQQWGRAFTDEIFLPWMRGTGPVDDFILPGQRVREDVPDAIYEPTENNAQSVSMPGQIPWGQTDAWYDAQRDRTFWVNAGAFFADYNRPRSPGGPTSGGTDDVSPRNASGLLPFWAPRVGMPAFTPDAQTDAWYDRANNLTSWESVGAALRDLRRDTPQAPNVALAGDLPSMTDSWYDAAHGMTVWENVSAFLNDLEIWSTQLRVRHLLHTGGLVGRDLVAGLQAGEFVSDAQTVGAVGGAPFFEALKAIAHGGGAFPQAIAPALTAQTNVPRESAELLSEVKALRREVARLSDRPIDARLSVGGREFARASSEALESYVRGR